MSPTVPSEWMGWAHLRADGQRKIVSRFPQPTLLYVEYSVKLKKQNPLIELPFSTQFTQFYFYMYYNYTIYRNSRSLVLHQPSGPALRVPMEEGSGPRVQEPNRRHR